MKSEQLVKSSPDNKKNWVIALARRYARWKLRRGLDGVFVQQLERVQSLSRNTPLIFAANHVSFWDPIMLVRLDELLGGGGYVLMDRVNLARLPFMGYLGALPISRNAPEAVEQELRGATEMLTRPGRALWIFPQGQHRPHHLRPLQIRPGVQRLVQLAQVPVIPVSFAYHFHHAPQPQVSIRFGQPIPASDPALRETLAMRLSEDLALLDEQYGNAHHAGIPLVSTLNRSPENGIGARLLGGRNA